MSIPRIEFSGVACRFGTVDALRGVSLSFGAGERIALVGPSGSGKSTLLRLAMGAARASAGAVLVDGADIASKRPRELRAYRRRCRLIAQNPNPPGAQRVHEFVAASRSTAWPWWKLTISSLFPQDVPEVRRLLDRVELAERQWARVHDLSGGEQQRIAVCRALSAAPDVLLADEPTSALDPTTAASVLSTIGDAVKASGATLVISTHRAAEVLDRVDRVIALRDGAVAFQGPPSELSEDVLAEVYRGSDERL